MGTNPIVPSTSQRERPFGPLWRVGLAIGLVATIGLIAALWPFLRALGVALTAAVEAHGDLIAGALLLLGGVMGGARCWQMIGRARQSHVITLQNGHPVPIHMLAGIARDEVHFGLDREYAAKLAEAERLTPLLTSQHLHIQHAQPPLVPAVEAAAREQLPPLPNGGTLAQLHGIGHICRSGKSLLVGYSDGQPQYIELAECGFIGIGGQPRVGKSTTSLLIIEQAVLSGWHVFVGDPHIQKADGLLNRCRPLSGRLAKQAVTPHEIAALIRLVDKIGKRRVDGDPDRVPIIVVLDEFSNLVWRDLLPADVLAVLPSMAAEYAGVGVHGVLIAHDWSKASLGGDLGAALRRAITHRIVHRMDPGNTEFLLPKGSSTQARAVAGLEKGRALFYGPDGAAMVAVPWLTDEDAAYAAQGTPARPYAPRPALASRVAHLAPTARVGPPRAAPLTVPMPPPTVPEQILDLLRGRNGWMTASEIASALAVDLPTVRTELSTMASAKVLRKRATIGKTTKEKVEYAVQPLQVVQPQITASA